MFKSILVICTGNICRSPYGEYILGQLLPQLKVTSAGIATEKSSLQGRPADAMAVIVAKEYGVDISLHIAKQVTKELVDEYDLILVMEQDQIDILADLIPTARHKAFLFGHWIGVSCIADPFRQDQHAFRHAFTTINSAAEAWARKFS